MYGVDLLCNRFIRHSASFRVILLCSKLFAESAFHSSQSTERILFLEIPGK